MDDTNLFDSSYCDRSSGKRSKAVECTVPRPSRAGGEDEFAFSRDAVI